jgi:hypothetical protein
LLFPAITGELMTQSSPNVIDLNGDGTLDIVFGTGFGRVIPSGGRYIISKEPDISGHVVAVSGATNEILWKVPNPRDAFTTPRFAHLNGDRVPDVLMGGREGAFSAFSGVDGKLLWRVEPTRVATTTFPYNFFTPALIKDVDRDGISDIVVVYGGNDTRLPKQPRDPSYLAVISGASGSVISVHASPDGNEMYTAVVVYERPDGKEWLIFGTGGETHGGAAYRVPVSALLDGSFPTKVQQLIPPGPQKGVIAPPTLIELNADGELDIVLSTFDGRLVVLNGASGEVIWQRQDAGEETYHSAAVARLTREGKPGLFVSRGIGAFPRYVGTVHRLFDAADGRILFEYREPNYPAGAPLAVDLNGDGIDEPFFFSVRFPSAPGAHIYILDRASSKLITHDLATNHWTTPVITDARGKGSLELISLSWSQAQTSSEPNWRDLQWQMMRMDLGTETPPLKTWAAYMGTATTGIYQPASTPPR